MVVELEREAVPSGVNAPNPWVASAAQKEVLP
jgi:hypothetical protein